MPTPIRLAIISTHPVQYYAPLFKALSGRKELTVHVFYGWHGPSAGAFDPGFGADVAWDVPLLEGYPHTFLENTSADPGTHHFRGITTPGLIPAVEAWEPDALLIFGWNYWSHLAALRHFKGRVPVYFRGDSTLLDEQGGPRVWARRLFLRWVYRHVDSALYVGQHNRAYFRAHGLTEDALRWVPHAIDNRRFADPEGVHTRNARAWCQKLGIPEEAPAAVFAGKLSQKKAPDVLIAAFKQLQGSNAHLIIAGSGAKEAALRAQAADHPRIHFIGFQNQSRMPVVYRLGDVVVLPSRGPGETWGLAINEAMASGRAVIASTAVGCAPDLITPGVNGAIVPPEDVDALRAALQQPLADEGLRARMGAASAARIADWSIPAAAERTYQAIAAQSTA